MIKPLEKLKRLVEAGKEISSKNSKAVQAIHDHSKSMGAQCDTPTKDAKESSVFSRGDEMTILTNELKEDIDPTAYIMDIFDSYLVYCKGYPYYGSGDNNCYQIDYTVDDTGEVTWGTPVEVVRKVTYVATTVDDPTMESASVEIVGETIPLLETNLSEASRMIKLIAPGWGSSGFYSEAVLKRDGPNVFKAGTHNYIDHPTLEEEKKRPEGTLTKLASTLKEDARWMDDYDGNGPGLYAPTNENTDYSNFLTTFKNEIGTSIRASGKASVGEANGRKGPIIEAITSARSVDYVTIPGAGGKVLELFESAKIQIKEKEVTPMADQPNTDALQESINKINARFIRGEAKTYIVGALMPLKVKEAIKDRITANVIDDVPLNEHGEINTTLFDAKIKAAIDNEMTYLSSVGSLGKISGFGGTTPVTEKKEAISLASFQESLKAFD